MQETASRTELFYKLSSSKFNYVAGYPVNLSLVVWLASRAFEEGKSQLTLGEWLLCVIGGLISWTFIEYLFHRFVYHSIELGTGHRLHHEQPKALLGVPWYLTTLIIIALYYAIALLIDPAITGVLMAFMWLGYILYCLVHHSVHHWNFKNSWFRYLRRHHVIHHAKPQVNWGVITPFWDRVFGTFYNDEFTAKSAERD